MFAATFKSIVGHWRRFLATSVVVIAAVAFLTGVLVFTDTISSSFDDLFATVYEDTDAAVRSSEVISSFGIAERELVDEEIVDVIGQVEGVQAIGAQVEGFAQISDAVGEPIGNPGQGPPALGFAWTDVPELNPWKFIAGGAPVAADEIVIDKASATLGGLSVGDSVTVQTISGSAQFKLVGVATFGSADSPGGASVVLFPLETAQKLFKAEGKLSLVGVVAEEGVSQTVISGRIKEALPGSYDVLTGEELIADSSDEVGESLAFLKIFLSVFAAIGIFVASFVIYNVFAIVTAQRKKELALFRAVGATRRQVLMSVFTEALSVGIVGSSLGLFFGVATSYGLRALLAKFGIELPEGAMVIKPATILIGLFVGILVTIISAFAPSWKASKVSPLEVFRAASAESRAVSKKRVASGFLCIGLGALSFGYGLFKPVLPLFGLGAAVLFIGIFVLGPVVAPFAAKSIGSVVARYGVAGEIAKGNALRNPKRTARTASALMIGVALVSMVAVLSSSFKSSIQATVNTQFAGNFVISPAGAGGPGVGVSPQIVNDLEALDDVAIAAGIGFALAKVEGEGGFGSVLNPATALELLDIDVTQGSAQDLDQSSILFLSREAERLNVSIGDSVSVQVSGIDETPLTVVGIYKDPTFVGNFVLDIDFYAEADAPPLNAITYVRLKEGVSPEQAKPLVEEVVSVYDNAELNDLNGFIEAQGKQLDQIVNIIYALLTLAVIIAIFGISITMLLSVLERTREIGLLRAVGMTRQQVRATIRFESIITAVFGVLQGILVGVCFGYAVIYALREQGVSRFSVSWLALCVLVVLACLLGIAASVVPARKAAKLNILKAISTT